MSQRTRIVIDIKERSVIERLQALGTTHEIITLDVGDMQVFLDNNLYAVFERKTYEDLAASIKGDRYREQKHRLMTMKAPVRGYILEGSASRFRMPAGTLEGALAGIGIRDRLTIIPTTDAAGTALLLTKMCVKLLEETIPYEEVLVNSLVHIATQSVSVSEPQQHKGDNYTPHVCYLAQLAQIPQVSYTTAAALAQYYPNIGLFIDVLRQPDGVKQIAERMVGGRRIGHIVAGRIKEFMLPTEPIIAPMVPKKVLITKKLVEPTKADTASKIEAIAITPAKKPKILTKVKPSVGLNPQELLL